MSSTLNSWLGRAGQQPDLGGVELPEWVERGLVPLRELEIHDYIQDPQRQVHSGGGRDGEGSEAADGAAKDHGGEIRYSAVLVLIGGDPGYRSEPGGEPGHRGARGVGGEHHTEPGAAPTPPDATILLTHRDPAMRKHSGQVAFPGGGWEPQDTGPIDTALREAWEETGLDPASVQPIAVLSPVMIPRSRSCVIPVLAYWTHPHEVHCASIENDWVQPYPLAQLIDPLRRRTVQAFGWQGPAWFIEGMLLWGFTALIIDTVLHCAGWEKAWEDNNPLNLLDALEASTNGEALGTIARHMRTPPKE